MSRHPDNLRNLILALQDQAVSLDDLRAKHVGDLPWQELQESGIVDTFDDSHLDQPEHNVVSLTAEGQMLSEALRDDAFWNDTKEALATSESPITASVLRQYVVDNYAGADAGRQ